MNNTKKQVTCALLAAIIIIMTFTPFGYFRTIGLEITLIPIPVVIGAITLGPVAGLILGGIFGITSFIQCFGMSALGTALFGINPFFAFILCIVPRLLMGWLCGLIFEALRKKTKLVVSAAAASLSGALLNTILFMSFLILLFGQSDVVTSLNSGGLPVIQFIVSLVGINGLIEAATCFIIGTSVSSAVYKTVRR